MWSVTKWIGVFCLSFLILSYPVGNETLFQVFHTKTKSFTDNLFGNFSGVNEDIKSLTEKYLKDLRAEKLSSPFSPQKSEFKKGFSPEDNKTLERLFVERERANL